MGYGPSVACECGAEEQTVDDVVIQCPIKSLGKITQFCKITKFVFLVIIFEPETLESQSKAQKTRILA